MTDPILAPGPRLEPIESPTGEPVPVTLLTGFLGAGKTTLLNRILNGDHGLKVGVLVNDFGSVNIDAELIEGVEENTIALSNGCVCCEVRDDLVTSLEDLLSGNRDVEYVLIEASGIADPEGIVMTISDPKYERLLRLDSVTCVVDADGLIDEGDNAPLMMLKLRQIGFSDLVILNKVDLVGPEQVERIEDWIGQYLRRVRIVEAEHADVPLEVLLSVGRFDPAKTADLEGEAQTPTDLGFETWHFGTEDPLSIDCLRQTIRKLPASVYRAKGFVYSAERPGERLLFQSVGRRVSITEHGGWDGRSPRTDLVVIGSDLDTRALQIALAACYPVGAGTETGTE